MFLSNRNEDHFYYGAILEVEYKDEICYIKVDQPDDYYFETSQQLDLSQLTVNKVIPIKSHYGPSYNFWEYLDWFSIFEIFMVISIPISFIIFAATFFPALARRKRRERNKTAD